MHGFRHILGLWFVVDERGISRLDRKNPVQIPKAHNGQRKRSDSELNLKILNSRPELEESTK